MSETEEMAELPSTLRPCSTSSQTVPRIIALGEYAAAALAQSDGTLRLIPGFAQTPYRLAGEHIIWVGTSGEAHPRAVFVDAPLLGVTLAWDGRYPSPTPLREHTGLAHATVTASLAALARRCGELGAPRGWGPLLTGERPAFPLDARTGEAHALAAAVAADDAAAFTQAGLRLLGVGGGLTPSGDDLVGATLFTLHHLGAGDARWQAAVRALNTAAHTRTHSISAALFADLARGASFAPLHQLLDAAGAANIEAMLAAARKLTAIGHSSGWDMLGGMVVAATGAWQPPSH